MRRNPYKIGRTRGISPRLKQWLNNLPSLKGHEGRWLRRGLIFILLIPIALLAVHFLKPETSLQNSVEIGRVRSKGVLTVAVRSDMPGFCENGEGLEAELALRLARRILPDAEEPLKLVPVTSTTVTTKLADGSVDLAAALKTKSSGSGYAYSYAYYTDTVYAVTLDRAHVSQPVHELRVGYIPNTPAGTVFASYVRELTAAPEQSMLDKLLRRPAPTAAPGSITSVDTVRLGSYEELLDALLSGRIDAAVMAGAYVHKYFEAEREALELPECYLLEQTVGEVEYRFMANSEDPALTRLADMMIYEMKSSGELDKLVEKYIGQRG
ncbi:MAG: transporter substrate-binding domain-containing protein [Clostridia bacterium]|nr:transporter substrate-binding domain-containing protein [Clostridia bacterium]MBQ4341209.1 transporter substrate-binding domain-containing protein [Clostridia bacterium]